MARSFVIHSLGGSITHWTVLALYLPTIHSDDIYPDDRWGARRKTHNLMSGIRIHSEEACRNMVKEWNEGAQMCRYVAIPATNYCGDVVTFD